MAWQDELQQLDSALAGGKITADEYRRQRDQLLAAAAGDPAPQVQAPAEPQSGAPAQPTTGPQPQQPGQQQGSPAAGPDAGHGTPFPAAFRWTPTDPGGSEATQAMGPVPRPGDQAADRTQVVAGRPGDADRTQVVPAVNHSGDATQVVRGGPGQQGFPPQAGGWRAAPPQQPPQQQGGPGDFAPPWGVGDGMPETGIPSWIRQGPEVFAEGGGRGKRIAIIAAILVVLIGGGVATYLILSGQHSTAAPASTAPPTPTTRRPPPGPKLPNGPFIALPGREVLNNTLSISDAVASNVPTQQEVAILHDNGIATVSGLISDENGLHRGLWAFTPTQGTSASAALTAMDQFYAASGYHEVVGAPAGVHELSVVGTGSAPTTYRAHYLTTKGVFVRVEAYGSDATTAQQAFNTLLNRELTKYPAAQ